MVSRHQVAQHTPFLYLYGATPNQFAVCPSVNKQNIKLGKIGFSYHVLLTLLSQDKT